MKRLVRIIVLCCLIFFAFSFLKVDIKLWKNLQDGISYKNTKYNFIDEYRQVLLHSFKIKQNKFKIFIKSFHDLNQKEIEALKEEE